ncbi:scaffold/adaptor protein [Lithospermum erythrorhizon]|uniref:Scaffold/adaptor protein n=1 Tax=Lithospermum erythrorhizon TaxID=34254 RepID=A0AAV3PSP1_LITER
MDPPNPNQRIKLNVGGKLFETTLSTLQSGGPDSLLSLLSNRPVQPDPIFIDRDPDIFSSLLSLLRSNRLPNSGPPKFTKQELIEEATYYGIETRVKSTLSPPPLTGLDCSILTKVNLPSDPIVSDFDPVDSDGSVWVAHGGQISVYDWDLSYSGTVRTHMDYVSCLKRVGSDVGVIGSGFESGLHFYNVANSSRVGVVEWVDESDPRVYKARVYAVCDSEESVFAAFDCFGRENCVLMVDKEMMRVSLEIGRQSGGSAKTGVVRKLRYVGERGVLVGVGVSCGAFGYSGYVRLWDPRSRDVVWEMNEPGSGRSSRYGDSFADVDVDLEEDLLFKLCSKSGDLAMADLRKLSDDPWIYLAEKNPRLSVVGGGSVAGNMVVHCYRKQVFLGRGGELEVWSKVVEKDDDFHEERKLSEGLYRRNFMDKEEDSRRGAIKKIEGGGDRLFVTREDVEGFEVWESSNFSSVVSIV